MNPLVNSPASGRVDCRKRDENRVALKSSNRLLKAHTQDGYGMRQSFAVGVSELS
jgi:hypothetical protein